MMMRLPLQQFLPSRATIQNFAETCVLAVLGGAIFNAAGLPAGYLSGAMFFTGVGALAGRPIVVPLPCLRVIFLAMGLTLGGVVTPETLRGMAAWPFSIAALGLTSVCSTLAGYSYLTRVHHWDPMSALLASTPGSLTQALIHAHEEKADIRGVAIVQTIRSSILSIGIPMLLAAFGTVGTPPILSTAGGPGGAGEYAILVGCCLVVSFVLHKLRFPGGVMFGAMMASAILHGTGLIHAQLPWWGVAAVMCGLGATIGSRFANTSLRLLASHIFAALGMFVFVVSVSMVFALAVASALDLRTADVVVSFTPGALDVMMMLSLALHLDPVFVGAHHLSRFVMVSLSMPARIRLVRRANPVVIPPPAPGD
jgi:membrane AbrB-like protein